MKRIDCETKSLTLKWIQKNFFFSMDQTFSGAVYHK